MKLDEFDYILPEELIAQEPLKDRAASRLLVLNKKSGEVSHKSFRDVTELLNPGDLLVLNNTRVTAFRLFGNKLSGGKVEALLLQEVKKGEWIALMKPGKKLKPGTMIEFGSDLKAIVEEDLDEGKKRITFQNENADQVLKELGRVPLPPYIHQALADPERYQTVYAETGGSAAAPTAGLHFTHEILNDLIAKGVKMAHVTLDVSIDTFRPTTCENVGDHIMHGEQCSVPPETAQAIAECEGRVIAVGTTTVRTLESFATGKRQLEAGSKTTKIFIVPGFEFQIVDAMFTNFHMPRTTMLLMISAMAGKESLLEAYKLAIDRKYRLLSFGDSMLIQ